MAKNSRAWWKNPKDYIFWLIYTPWVALLVSVIFNILSLSRPASYINFPSGQNYQITTDSSPIAVTPKKLYKFINQYPIIQRGAVFRNIYSGRIVCWQGSLIYAYKSPVLYFHVKKG